MKKQIEIDSTLEIFRAQQGENFQLDEPALQKAYAKANADRSGIAVKVLTLIGAVLVTCAFLGFLFLVGFYESSIGMSITGFFFIAGSLTVKKLYDKLVLDTFAVSFYACGCLLILLGVMESRMDESAVSLMFLIIALFSMGFVQNYMMSFVAAAIAYASIIALVMSFHRYDQIHILAAIFLLFFTYWLLDEARIIRSSNILSRLYHPIRMATLLTVLYMAWHLSSMVWKLYIPYLNWVTGAAALGAVIFLVPKILQTLGSNQPASKWIGFAAAIITLAPTIWAPGIAIGILVILVSFYVNFITGYIAGIIALIYSISQFYYNLQLTLLTKSLMMMATGFFFLLLYFITHKKLAAK